MKKPSCNFYIITFSLLFWSALFITRMFELVNTNGVSRFSAQAELVFHVFMMFVVFNIYKHTKVVDRKILFWLLLANICLFLNDIAFYLVVYFPHNYLINLSVVSFVFDMVPYTGWVIAFIVFLSKLLMQDIFTLPRFLKIFSILISINLVIIVLFLSSIHYAFGGLSWQSIIQVISTMGELIIFDLSILCLIYSESRGLSFILAGFVVLISGDFIINYSFLSQTDTMEAYGELLWFLGLLFIFFGMLNISKDKIYEIKSWLRRMHAIKSKLAFWAFGISVINILPFFVFSYFFSPINKEVFLILPPFIMITAVAVVVISIVTGQNFERPFKQIAHNIEILMLENNKNKIDSDFSIDEFIFLQKFISDAYDLKEERDRAKKALGELTAQVAHDIRSPLSALNTSIKHLPQLPEKQRILIRNAANRINDIANNLLHQYKSDGLEPKGGAKQLRTWLLAPLLESIISEKRLQFEDKPIGLNEVISSEGLAAFAEFDAHRMKRLISNLINNAAEAFCGKRGKITLELDADAKYIFLNVQDNGCGIPAAKLKEVLKPGVSLKEDGSGLGLSHAKETVESYGGALSISSQEGKGTAIMVKLLRARAPEWFVSEILVSLGQPIAVLDDDQSVHGAWDQRLLSVSDELTIHHFQTPQSFEKWYQAQDKEIQVLSDYELLGEKQSGLDIIEALEIQNAVLVTSHYESPEIINRCQRLNTHLLPKNLLAHVPIQLIEERPHSDAASVQGPQSVELFDAVLIDDSELIRQSWELAATLSDKKVLCFASTVDFEKAIAVIDFKTPIYIDSELGEKINGEVYAKSLFNKGFKKLYMVTGKAASDFDDMSWIIRVVDKDPPF